MASIDFATQQIILNKVGNKLEGQGRVEFENFVLDAGAAIQEFSLGYGGTDHQVQKIAANVSNVSFSGTAVYFDVALELSDRSNHYIDNGTVTVAVSACLE